MKPVPIAVSLALLFSLGCGGSPMQGKKSASQARESVEAGDGLALRQPAAAAGGPRGADARPAMAMAPAAAAGGEQQPAPAEPPARKIKYTADIKLVVEDLAKAEESMLEFLKAHKGFVAQAETTGSTGSPRSGRWRLRVPVKEFDAFKEEVVKLGVPQKNTTDSEDVTEEYYDVEARIKNKKKLEERLLNHLKESTGKLDEVLKVEQQLDRVREDIERLEGRLRLLANLTDLTTVTVNMQEIKDYVPPQAPTFGASITNTFNDSFGALTAFGKGLVLFAVALTPWLPLLAVIVVPSWLLVRRLRRRSVEVVTVLEAEPPAAPSGG